MTSEGELSAPFFVFPVTGDAIALAKFTASAIGNKTASIIELGCGSGGIMAEIAVLCPNTTITGIDISPAAVASAKSALCGLSNASVAEADLRCFTSPNKFDYCVFNPPYFKAGSGRVPKNAEALPARQEVTATLGDFIGAAVRLLIPAGSAAFCIPASRLAEAFRLCDKTGIEPKRMLLTKKTAFIEAKRGAKPGLIIEDVN